MTSRLVGIYHRLPAGLRTLAASLYGYRLLRRRYGPETEQLVAEALRYERLPVEEIRRRQIDDLKSTLMRAAELVPYYRRFWSSPAARGRDRSCLEHWPILEKDALRERPEDFLAIDRAKRDLICEHTSGTTGTPLRVWWSTAAVRRHYALSEARWRRWYGVSRNDRWAILGGQLVVPVSRHRPPFWVWNRPLRQLYMSSYHLDRNAASSYFDALKQFGVQYLLGYSSSLYALAQDALATGRTDLQMRVAITNAEPLLPAQRDVISRAFRCPVRETYGMTENVAAAGECEAGRLHLWPETGFMEVLDGDRPVAPGQVGDLVCTGLLNDAMPLIRYRVGDRGAMAPDESICTCGRTLPRLLQVEGRSDDVLFTPDGRRVGRLDTVFKSNWPIREAQIIQEQLDLVRIRFVPAANFSAEVAAEMIAEVKNRLGDVRITLEPTDVIERSANGKFRAVICNLPRSTRDTVDATPSI